MTDTYQNYQARIDDLKTRLSVLTMDELKEYVTNPKSEKVMKLAQDVGLPDSDISLIAYHIWDKRTGKIKVTG